MADNVAITAGSGTTIATDDVSGVQYQRVKLAYGADGSATDVNTGAGLPVSDAGGSLTVDGTVAISGTVAVTDNSGTLSIDDGAGSITVDGTVSAAQSGTWTVQPGNTANTTAWKVDGSAVTQPVSSATFATAAKQPALGTAGTASSDVITVQGITSMTALKVDGSGVTQPVSAASLPLPSGAATAAKQPALGTAGSSSTDVISVQGIASGTALPASQSGTWTVQPGNTANTTAWKVDGSAVTQPVSGTVTSNANTSSTASLANVSSSATSVTLFSSNASAKGRMVQNDSTQVAYINFGATASATAYTVQLPAGAYYEFPRPCYTGAVNAIWASANGSGRTTELT